MVFLKSYRGRRGWSRARQGGARQQWTRRQDWEKKGVKMTKESEANLVVLLEALVGPCDEEHVWGSCRSEFRGSTELTWEKSPEVKQLQQPRWRLK